MCVCTSTYLNVYQNWRVGILRAKLSSRCESAFWFKKYANKALIAIVETQMLQRINEHYEGYYKDSK